MAQSIDAEATPNPTPPTAIHRTAPLLTPGKVALWLFLGTEVMFFTGLIGSYIVLRAGSPAWAYSNLFPPGTPLDDLRNARGLVIDATGPDDARIAETIAEAVDSPAAEIEHQLHSLPTVVLVNSPLQPADIDGLTTRLQAAGAMNRLVPLDSFDWPRPYDKLTNPLSIDLTAVNTFILICSSVTMVLALSAIQRDDKRRLSRWLLATILIGSTFVGIQVYEYYQLMEGHRYSIGVSPTGHFRPNSSLFASCFFTMTGFHGAHVTGGILALLAIWLRSLFGGYSREHHSPVELVGLYWHFVDLVWILLFTVVYLL